MPNFDPQPSEPKWSALQCPLPHQQQDTVLLAHGGGGRLTAELLQGVFLPAFANRTLSSLEDQASLDYGTLLSGEVGYKLAFTTDSFVVRPLFFPGGDIGKLAVCGTLNDLAVGGAKPRHLAAAFIIEEGLPIADLKRVVASMQAVCLEAGVSLVAGDTKVVERGKGDQLFITTTGLGLIPPGRNLSISAAQPGDVILVSGTLGDHGMAILAAREEGLGFSTPLFSDCALLVELTERLLEAVPTVRCMRDPTRGGLAAVAHELAAASQVGVVLEERSLPYHPAVRGATEVLGLNPLELACEGRLVAVVAAADAALALATLQEHPLGQGAATVGTITAARPGTVTMRTLMGVERLVMLFAGEHLPRIC